MKKKTILTLCAFIFIMSSLTACSKKNSESSSDVDSQMESTSEETEEETTEEITTEAEPVVEEKEVPLIGTITVGAVDTTEHEILQQAVPLLRNEGYELAILSYSDYVTPNEAVENGECDASYCIHQEYLTIYNEKRGANLVGTANIHLTPLGLYPGVEKSISAIANGAKIAIPDDTIGQMRALLLLQDKGFITLRDGIGLTATLQDIVDNPKNLEITAMEVSTIPDAMDEYSFVVMDGNHALEASLNPVSNPLLLEDASSTAAERFGRLLVTKEEEKESEKIKALIKVLKSDEIQKYMRIQYHGSILPL